MIWEVLLFVIELYLRLRQHIKIYLMYFQIIDFANTKRQVEG